ncbi:class I SAM-dependent methyltransferase [Paenarthrobacter aurescens]|nr:class I SAM-dependent methyltransferase [Paenarthrobacter aurescens]MDO6143643.1 class I SAM-dependent methyltransferase [Paenarthrobacter aurescens]MDO6147491.1 class I SAM-dependent methyltransferase [Paenarthrobacter aurescens]MDO6158734.1 class I SAM-dependent methyltransferase [Paenarthrobacter aurescens]MDO6162718.1 class I SAM-dependent methyltransferase [Paenarthrobacter aurescens]
MSPWGSLQARDVQAVEEMDRADCDPNRLHRTYARFPVVNGLLSGWHRTYRHRLRPMLATNGSVSVLDIGCGSGDVARSLARWARRDGFRLSVTAIDPDERAFAFASRTPPVEGVVYRKAHSSELVAEGRTFDVVISNHILHHLGSGELTAVLRDSELLSRGLCLHNDLNRSNIAYLLFLAGFWPLGVGSYICVDGLTSIRRSYTAPELAAAVPDSWSVERNGPWHHLLVQDSRDNDA